MIKPRVIQTRPPVLTRWQGLRGHSLRPLAGDHTVLAGEILARHHGGQQELYPEAWLVFREMEEQEALQEAGDTHLTQVTLRLMLNLSELYQSFQTAAKPETAEAKLLLRQVNSCLHTLALRDREVSRELRLMLEQLTARHTTEEAVRWTERLTTLRQTLFARLEEVERRQNTLVRVQTGPAETMAGPVRPSYLDGRFANRTAHQDWAIHTSLRTLGRTTERREERALTTHKEKLLTILRSADREERERVWELVEGQTQLTVHHRAVLKESDSLDVDEKLTRVIRASSHREYTRLLQLLEGQLHLQSTERQERITQAVSRENIEMTRLLMQAAPALGLLEEAMKKQRIWRNKLVKQIQLNTEEVQNAFVRLVERSETVSLARSAQEQEATVEQRLNTILRESRRSELEELVHWTRQQTEASSPVEPPKPAPRRNEEKALEELQTFLTQTRTERREELHQLLTSLKTEERQALLQGFALVERELPAPVEQMTAWNETQRLTYWLERSPQPARLLTQVLDSQPIRELTRQREVERSVLERLEVYTQGRGGQWQEEKERLLTNLTQTQRQMMLERLSTIRQLETEGGEAAPPSPGTVREQLEQLLTFQSQKQYKSFRYHLTQYLKEQPAPRPVAQELYQWAQQRAVKENAPLAQRLRTLIQERPVVWSRLLEERTTHSRELTRHTGTYQTEKLVDRALRWETTYEPQSPGAERQAPSQLAEAVQTGSRPSEALPSRGGVERADVTRTIHTDSFTAERRSLEERSARHTQEFYQIHSQRDVTLATEELVSRVLREEQTYESLLRVLERRTDPPPGVVERELAALVATLPAEERMALPDVTRNILTRLTTAEQTSLLERTDRHTQDFYHLQSQRDVVLRQERQEETARLERLDRTERTEHRFQEVRTLQSRWETRLNQTARREEQVRERRIQEAAQLTHRQEELERSHRDAYSVQLQETTRRRLEELEQSQKRAYSVERQETIRQLREELNRSQKTSYSVQLQETTQRRLEELELSQKRAYSEERQELIQRLRRELEQSLRASDSITRREELELSHRDAYRVERQELVRRRLEELEQSQKRTYSEARQETIQRLRQELERSRREDYTVRRREELERSRRDAHSVQRQELVQRRLEELERSQKNAYSVERQETIQRLRQELERSYRDSYTTQRQEVLTRQREEQTRWSAMGRLSRVWEDSRRRTEQMDRWQTLHLTTMNRVAEGRQMYSLSRLVHQERRERTTQEEHSRTQRLEKKTLERRISREIRQSVIQQVSKQEVIRAVREVEHPLQATRELILDPGRKGAAYPGPRPGSPVLSDRRGYPPAKARQKEAFSLPDELGMPTAPVYQPATLSVRRFLGERQVETETTTTQTVHQTVERAMSSVMTHLVMQPGRLTNRSTTLTALMPRTERLELVSAAAPTQVSRAKAAERPPLSPIPDYPQQTHQLALHREVQRESKEEARAAVREVELAVERQEPELRLLKRKSQEQERMMQEQNQSLGGLKKQLERQEVLVRQVLERSQGVSQEEPAQVKRLAKAVMKELESQLRLERQRRGMV